MIQIFNSPFELAEGVAEDLTVMIEESAAEKKPFTLAISGGNTPKLLFSLLAEKYAESVSWEFVHFFWVDERCVPENDSESNFGMTYKALLGKIRIPALNIHKISGENDPVEEAVRYSDEIVQFARNRNGLPVFDLIILGLGEDGHTASIFPGNNILFNSEKICETVFHPVTLQKRITVTGRVINNADNIIFIVTGENKAGVVSSILKKERISDYPAEHVRPETGNLKWYLDDSAAKYINRKVLN